MQFKVEDEKIPSLLLSGRVGQNMQNINPVCALIRCQLSVIKRLREKRENFEHYSVPYNGSHSMSRKQFCS